MSTLLYLTQNFAEITRGKGDANLRGTTYPWSALASSTSMGTGDQAASCTTVASDTAGIEVNYNSYPIEWISPPLAADYTISGTIYPYIRAYESSMSANAAPRVVVQRIDSQGIVQSTVVNTAYTTEVGTSMTACNWSASPTSTAFYKGDRIRILVAATNVGTMGGGYTFYVGYNGTTLGGNYDSRVAFTEDLTFITSDPAGTTIYPTSTSLEVLSSSETALISDTFGSNISGWNADNWTPYANNYAAIAWSSGEGDPDAGSLQITCNSSGNDQATMRPLTGLTLYAGYLYTLRFRIKRISGTGNWQWCFGSDGTSSNRASNQWNQSITTSWVEKTLEWSPTTNCTDPTIWIACYGSTTQVAVVDTVSVSEEYGGTQREVWTSRGSGVTTSVTNTAAGWTNPIQATATAGGSTLIWWTKQLTAFTLGGKVKVNVRSKGSSFGAHAGMRCEIAVCNSDGSGATVWAASNTVVITTTSEAARTIYLAGDDLSVTDGQRLRVRFFIDDQYDLYDAITYQMGSGSTITLYYAGSSGATGDTYLTFTQSLSEYSGSATQTGDFDLDAIIKKTISDDFTLDAVLLKTIEPAGFTLDAEIKKTISDDFTLDAVVLAQTSDDFTLDAVVLRQLSDDLTLDAWIITPVTGTPFTLDAWVITHVTPTPFTLDAVVTRTMPSSIFLDAWVAGSGGTVAGGFTLDAVINRTQGGTPFTLDAVINELRADDLTLDAIILAVASDDFTLDAVVLGPVSESFTLDAWISSAAISDDFTLDAWVEPEYAAWSFIYSNEVATSFTLDAWIAGRFTLDAVLLKARSGDFSLDALLSILVTDSFALDAETQLGVLLDAVILGHQGGRFYLEAFLSRQIFTLDAELGAGGVIVLDAVIVRAASDSFVLDAWIFDGTTRTYGWSLDAVIEQTLYGGFPLAAQIGLLITQGGGSAPVDAVVLDTMSGTMVLDAELDSGARSGSFALDADILGLNEQRGIFVLDAMLRAQYGDRFALDAILESREVFRLDAWLAGTFTLDAVLNGVVDDSLTLDAWISGTFTLDAWISGILRGSFALDAVMADADGAFSDHWGSFTLDALILAGMSGQPPIWLNAWIYSPGLSGSFTLDAYVQPWFTLDAWIAREDGGKWGGLFSLEAYIWGNDTIIWPDEQSGVDGVTTATDTFSAPSASFNAGMVGSTITIEGVSYTIVSVVDEHTITISPAITSGQSGLSWSIQPNATYPDGEPIPAWFKSSRKYRVNITLDGVDVTGDVIWHRTSFSQNAKTNPGTFELTLKGVSSLNGGEVTIVTLDDRRVFGGYVLSVERSYSFGADPDDVITVLRGADFNVLFDKLIVYNKESADDPSGAYTNWKSFKKDTLDSTIIARVFSSYVDLPAGFDYTSHVETVGNAAPEKPWTMPQAGSPLRQVMQSLSQVTNAVWWIDVHMKLHYGNRYDVTAPYPITDGLGGISSQNISMSEDISKLVTETILWGTLAYTVEGEIMAVKKVADSYPTYGPWQYGEFRIDLHHEAYLERRTDSIIERYGQPIRRAKVVIFDPGYEAGQVADVRLTEHGISEPLVIRQLELTFAVAKEPEGDRYYAVPRYELTIGLDPEEPWDIYDYLPFPDDEGTDYPPRRGREEERTGFGPAYPGTNTKWAPYGGGSFAELHDGAVEVIVGPGSEEWMWAYYDDNNWHQPGQGIYQTPLENYTYGADTVVFPGGSVAGFESYVSRGEMYSYSTGDQTSVEGWEIDLGPWPAQPGHESHTGDDGPNMVPYGDLELRTVMMVERDHSIPMNSFYSRLYSHREWDEIGQQWIMDYDIRVMLQNAWIWNEGRGAASVEYKGYLTHASESEGPPDFHGGGNFIRGIASVSNSGWNSIGSWAAPYTWPDLLWVLGSLGCDADPVNYNDRYCPLDYDHIYDPQPGSELRWPAGPRGEVDYLFCPFHLGLQILDAHVFGQIPVKNSLYASIAGVEISFPTGPGWGWAPALDVEWSGTRYEWISGSDPRLDQDSSCDYLAASGTIRQRNGMYHAFLALPIPPDGEKDTYYYTQSSVQTDPHDPRQATSTACWKYEFVGYFDGASGDYGDQWYGPGLQMSFGPANIEVFPGLRSEENPDVIGVWDTGGGLPQWYIDTPVDLYSPFHVQMVGSDLGWGIKVWQNGDDTPEDWFAWFKYTESDPGANIGARPYLKLWQDRWRHDEYASPYEDINLRFVCMDFAILDGIDPISFGLGWDSPPGDGSDPMPRRIDDPDGEIFGMIGDGWNFETRYVDGGRFETTARVTRGTLAVYDGNGSFLLPDDDWNYDGGDGQHFVVHVETDKVTVVYRAWVVNIRSEYSVPRQPDPSGIRHRPIPEPF